ncbi:MAG: hypothetical protein FWG90_09125 [Oscillospiraceae bacterium]|nr:hypothetical protein [Oscillospiraceae bacterium]
MAGTASREYVKTQIDYLPEAQLDEILRAINAVKLRLVSKGVDPDLLFKDDTEYLSAVPGMVDKILASAAEPLSDCVHWSEVILDV